MLCRIVDCHDRIQVRYNMEWFRADSEEVTPPVLIPLFLEIIHGQFPDSTHQSNNYAMWNTAMDGC